MHHPIKAVGFSKFCILLGLLSPIALLGQTQCPADAPNGFTIEEVGDSCYIVFTWPKDEMPELTCGSPGSPVAGSSTFRGKLLNMTLEGTTVVYENGSNCSGSTFNFDYHPSLADSYITSRSYCDLTALPSVSFVCNRTQGSNFTCDQTNNGTSNAPMPIGLSEFYTSTGLEGKVQLFWETDWEENNKEFQVERSKDGKRFTTIHSQPGKGNSFTPQTYSYLDSSPVPGLNYYRLKQIDYDGQFSYSKIISLQYRFKSTWSCYPTLTNGLIYITGKTDPGELVRVRVIDLLGRTIIPSKILLEDENQIDLSELTIGSYIILLTQDNQVSQSYRVIKR